MSGTSTDGLLLDLINQTRLLTGRLAVVETKLDAGAVRHQEFRDTNTQLQESVDKLEAHAATIDTKVTELKEEVKPVAVAITAMEPRVKKLEIFHGRFGAIMGIASAVMMGAAYLIWEAIKVIFTSDFVTGALRRLLS
jgi:septal ring factor EnvC (AmiA/AmiB activator)